MAMAGSIESMFLPQQATALRAFMGEVMANAGTEAAANLTQQQDGLKAIIQQMSDKQTEMQKIMEKFDEEKGKMQAIMEKFGADSGGMGDQVKVIKKQLDSLALEEVDRRVAGLVNNL